MNDQYVASFGKDAALGCFDAAEPIALRRGDLVLLRTPRGLEVGSILCPATIRQARLLGAQVRGELVRPVSSADSERLASNRAVSQLVFRATRDLDPALVVLDVDVLFDGRLAILHLLHPDPDSLGDFARTLGERVGLEIRLANLAQPIEEPAVGCGKPDCGSGAGGCSTCSTGGGCSSCGAPGAVDLKPYFAHLRSQMEATQRVPLN